MRFGSRPLKKRYTKVLLRPEKKSSIYFVVAGKFTRFFVVAENFYYDRKKKDTVVCLAGARSLLRPEKKKIQSSVGRVRDHIEN